MLLWLQRAWSEYLLVAVKKGVILVDVYNTYAKLITLAGAKTDGRE